MLKAVIKEQAREDILSILDRFGIREVLLRRDYDRLAAALCQVAVDTVDKSIPKP
jgi:hypothetical protein